MSGLSVTWFKRCTKCKCTKPRTTQFFSRSKARKDGLDPHCKACRKAYAAENADRLKAYRKAYYLENREAMLAQNREYHEEHRDRLISYHREYRQANLEERQRKEREYNEAHRVERNIAAAKYREKNREAIRERNRKWGKENVKAKVENNHRRRVLLNGAKGTHTTEEVQQMLADQGYRCAYCEESLDSEYHRDHMIPVSRGGSNDWTNLCVACIWCNLSKKDKTAEEFWECLKVHPTRGIYIAKLVESIHDGRRLGE